MTGCLLEEEDIRLTCTDIGPADQPVEDISVLLPMIATYTDLRSVLLAILRHFIT